MNERKSDGQDTTDDGSLSDPWAFHTQYVGDFAFTEIDKNTRSIRMNRVSPTDLQNYRDIITSITNDKSLLDNYGALRMARHIDSRVKTIRSLVTERDALQRTVAGMREALEQIVRGANGDPYGFAEEVLAALTTPTREGSTDV